jgi:cell division protein FtsL
MRSDLSEQERIEVLARYEGSFSELEKLALETMARTARPPLEAFELSMKMMRLRAKIHELRSKMSKKS